MRISTEVSLPAEIPPGLPDEDMRPVVLTFSGFYLPGEMGGGPIRTIANMVERLSDDFQFLVVTSDRDLGATQPYQGVRLNQWNCVGKAKVFYVKKHPLSFFTLVSLIRKTPHDILYLNSFFDRMFSIKILLARLFWLVPKVPLLLAPRGEFSLGALQLKRLRKTVYIRLGSMLGLFKNVVWHASTSHEAADVKRALSAEFAEIRVATNISVAPDLLPSDVAGASRERRVPKENAPLQVCFLSRISRKKNLDFALKVLARVQVPVNFSIYGPKEDAAYWAECEILISALPIHITATYCGSVDHDDVCSVISKYDVFFLPTRGENFGHVFLEAWSAGVPVLVSDQTPWRSLAERHLGWDIPLEDTARFVDVLSSCSKGSGELREKTESACIEFAREMSQDLEALELNKLLFRRLV